MFKLLMSALILAFIIITLYQKIIDFSAGSRVITLSDPQWPQRVYGGFDTTITFPADSTSQDTTWLKR